MTCSGQNGDVDLLAKTVSISIFLPLDLPLIHGCMLISFYRFPRLHCRSWASVWAMAGDVFPASSVFPQLLGFLWRRFFSQLLSNNLRKHRPRSVWCRQWKKLWEKADCIGFYRQWIGKFNCRCRSLALGTVVFVCQFLSFFCRCCTIREHWQLKLPDTST